MTTANLTEILERIQPDLKQVESQASKEAVSILLNIVEKSVAESIKLKNENQTLKDEINVSYLNSRVGFDDINE